MLATITKEISDANINPPTSLFPPSNSGTTLNTLLAQNPLKNITEELSLQHNLFSRLTTLHNSLLTRSNFYNDITDYPQRFATQSGIDDLELINLTIDTDVSFLVRHVAKLQELVGEKIKVLEMTHEDIEVLKIKVQEGEDSALVLNEEGEKLRVEIADVTSAKSEGIINEKTGNAHNLKKDLLKSLELETDRLAADLAPLQHTKTKLVLVQQSLQEEIESARPALEQLNVFVKEMDEANGKIDPRVSFLGIWVREAIALLQIVTGVLLIHGDAEKFCVQYNDNLGGKVVVENGVISIEVLEDYLCE
jgi:hypothetical protein